MKVHHLNCASMNPVGKRLINGSGGWFEPADIVTHCLLLETDHGLVLVDSGLSRKDVENPGRLGKAFTWMMNPALDDREPAYVQIQELGFNPTDVNHIILTHLDIDHAAGLVDFPDADVHVLREEYDFGHSPPILERMRYNQRMWEHDPNWFNHGTDDGWFGFESVDPLPGKLPEVKMVSLPGHSGGHCGVAIQCKHKTDYDWLLHCGDAYFYAGEMNPGNPESTPGFRLQQRVISHDNGARLDTQERLRELKKNHENVELVCSHSREDFERVKTSS